MTAHVSGFLDDVEHAFRVVAKVADDLADIGDGELGRDREVLVIAVSAIGALWAIRSGLEVAVMTLHELDDLLARKEHR